MSERQTARQTAGAVGFLDRGREAFARLAWADACTDLFAADKERPLEPEDLERLATAAYLAGKGSITADIWVRAHQEFLNRGQVERAARCAFWLAFGLLNRGDRARAGGWTARASRLLDDAGRDCVERGYLLLPVAFQHVIEGDPPKALASFSQAGEIGQRFGEPDLVNLARHSRGRVLMRMGAISEGVALLDEAMVAVEAGEVSPMVVGDLYCSVIEGCLEIFDLRRAQEWTAALTHWCESQQDLVPYSGQCLVRRSEILQLHGAWTDALDEAQRACDRLAERGEPAAGSACYQRAELHRLRGEFASAEEAYRQAARWGRKPQPGLAQLRLAQGHLAAAEAAIRQAVDEAQERRIRSRLLPAYVEIVLATNDIPAARAASDELSDIAADLNAPLLHALSAHATGAVLLAAEDARAALAAPGLRLRPTTSGQLEDLDSRIEGRLLSPGDEGWDAAVLVWNGMAAKVPALIAQPTSADDVAAVVGFARDHRLRLSIKGGGHNIAGTSIAEGGLALEMSRMRDSRSIPRHGSPTSDPGAC